MADKTYLTWPFFDDSHRKLAADLELGAMRMRELFKDAHRLPLDDSCRKLYAR